MTNFESTQEWLFGDMAQKERRDECARCGEAVVPTFAMKRGVEGVVAPMLLGPGGHLIVAADLMVAGTSGFRHEEVKAKSRPGYLRHKGAWTHGFDYSLLREYIELQERTGLKVFVLVRESYSPKDPDTQSDLIPSNLWLVVALDDIRPPIGHRAVNWPKRGGEGSRMGQGGWCWERWRMTVLDPSTQAGVVAAMHARMLKTDEDIRRAIRATENVI